MKYKLYHSPTSPYTRKVLVLLHELDLLNSVNIVAGLSPDSIASHPNPLIKIPTLVTPDKLVLYDSTVICEYLDLKYSPYKYFPNKFDLRIKTLLLHSLAVGVMDAALTCVYEERRDAKIRSNEVFIHQKIKIVKALSYLNNETKFLADNWNIASISVAVAWDYAMFRLKKKIDFTQDYANLINWREGLKGQKISLDDTLPFE